MTNNPNLSVVQFGGATIAGRRAGAALGQVAAAYNEDGGSFSMKHLAKGQVVSAGDLHPNGGYMVGVAGTEKTTGVPVKTSEIAQHLAEHGSTEADVYEGGWKQGDKIYLDKSRRFPPSEKGLSEAKAVGRAGDQIAAYALGGTKGIEHNPEWGGDVRLHTEDFGANDVDPNHRPTGNPGVLSRNEYSHPQGDITGPGVSGMHNGQPVTMNHILDTINENRAQKSRDSKKG